MAPGSGSNRPARPGAAGDVAPRRLVGERGSAAPMFAVLVVAMLAAVAIAVDGGNKLGAIAEARDVADNTARAGAQMLDEATYRTTGAAVVDPDGARARALEYLASTGHTGTVTVEGATVTATVVIEVPGVFLPATTVTATETAEAVTGP